jgi:hypothetical protein
LICLENEPEASREDFDPPTSFGSIFYSFDLFHPIATEKPFQRSFFFGTTDALVGV